MTLPLKIVLAGIGRNMRVIQAAIVVDTQTRRVDGYARREPRVRFCDRPRIYGHIRAVPAGVVEPVFAPLDSSLVLASATSMQRVDTAEEAPGVLRTEPGCVRNDVVAHNAGWFVPGQPIAFASALDAVKALALNLKAGGTLYVPLAPNEEQMRAEPDGNIREKCCPP
ncbi:hypothetical protein [Paraburkholderia sp. A1RO-5L]|uniref:hypothetical protein n=1 Tax=unclassified Paraburkholderia TaxID=2615204 RepID=UPI003B8283F6